LKNDVNVPTFKNEKTERKKLFFVGVLKVTEEPDPEPNPLVKGTDPRIRIRTKMSRIRNTGIFLCVGSGSGSGLDQARMALKTEKGEEMSYFEVLDVLFGVLEVSSVASKSFMEA
jgi:hypothetical protein